MKTFIKVIEIWAPKQDRKSLILADSYYGDYLDFNKQSQKVHLEPRGHSPALSL